MSDALLPLSVFVPLLAGVCVFLSGGGARSPVALSGVLLSLAISLLLVMAVGSQGTLDHALAGWEPPLGIRLHADGLAALMILLTAVVGALVSLHAVGQFAGKSEIANRFWTLWLLLWGSLNALFLSADLFNVYVTLELVTLAAIPLVLLAGSRQSVSASLNYLLLALFGSLLYLGGVALIYGMTGTLDLQLIGERLPAGGWPVGVATALIVAGLLVKAAIVPFHFWLPPAHGGAPAPVSALLSALVVKAAVYLLLRLWAGPLQLPLSAPWVAQLLGALGAAAIILGSIQAMRQPRLKLVVAYSTVAQLGYILLFFPLAVASAWQGAVYHGLAHGVAKAALFLAAGNMLYHLGHDRVAELRGMGRPLALSLGAFAIASVSIMGLPPSGGFIAKWLLLQSALEQGLWWIVATVLVGGLLAAGYVFRVMRYAFMEAHAGPSVDRAPTPAQPLMVWSALTLAVLSIVLGFTARPLLTLLGEIPLGGG
ncbi:MAG: proton-conducting membrane transporter [Ectothiorhodospiraceae bacterium]|nr:proton-conducting membrane transporter [Ectothiorhodospiraceae bacterium]